MKKRQTEQLDRFKKKARELGVDESPDALDRSFDKLELKRGKDAGEKPGSVTIPSNQSSS